MKDIFTRSKLNPILKPKKNGFWKVYNPGAALDAKGSIHLFPRVMKKEKNWHSQIAHAISKNGEKFVWHKKVSLSKKGKGEARGLEDPRITKIGNTYHMVFAAFDGHDPKLHSATTKNLNGPWQRHGLMVPNFRFYRDGGKKVRFKNGKIVIKKDLNDKRHWSKSGSLFPEKINCKYYLLFGEYNMWLATSTDGKKFTVDKKPLMNPRNKTQFFDSAFIEMGPPPIKTDKGWLVLYHGIDEAFRYQLGFVVLDIKNPKKVIYRSTEPIFGPKEKYEVGDALIDVIPGGIEAMRNLSSNKLKEFYKKAREEKNMPQVTFCPGAIVKDDMLYIYYGAGDTSVCMARTPLKAILDMI